MKCPNCSEELKTVMKVGYGLDCEKWRLCEKCNELFQIIRYILPPREK